MFDLFTAAAAGGLDALAGVKYVSPDIMDFMTSTAAFPDKAFMWAPEPKLQSFPFSLGAGTILAEDFFAPTYLRMYAAWVAGDVPAALAEQKWKMSIVKLFAAYAGDAERSVYPALCGFDIGPPRPPNQPVAPADAVALHAALSAAGFFNQTWPAGRR